MTIQNARMQNVRSSRRLTFEQLPLTLVKRAIASGISVKGRWQPITYSSPTVTPSLKPMESLSATIPRDSVIPPIPITCASLRSLRQSVLEVTQSSAYG